jgi:hypothetical protein
MKILFLTLNLIFLFDIAKAQILTFENQLLKENSPDLISSGYNNYLRTPYEVIVIGDINPFYLEADYNGDGHLDIAFLVKNRSNQKRGILIIHGKLNESYLLGAGNSFEDKGDDWNWLEVWQVYRSKTAEVTTFTDTFDIDGSETVELKNTAIYVSMSESAGNLLMWNGTEYEWIHTGS